jgi:hypothetical protein
MKVQSSKRKHEIAELAAAEAKGDREAKGVRQRRATDVVAARTGSSQLHTLHGRIDSDLAGCAVLGLRLEVLVFVHDKLHGEINNRQKILNNVDERAEKLGFGLGRLGTEGLCIQLAARYVPLHAPTWRGTSKLRWVRLPGITTVS